MPVGDRFGDKMRGFGAGFREAGIGWLGRTHAWRGWGRWKEAKEAKERDKTPKKK